MKHVLLSLSFLFTSAFAETNSDLQNLLNNVSEFTTDTKLNIDYQPSILTILYSSDLELLGVQTLHEALNFIPGIETTLTSSGISQVIARGVSEPNDAIHIKMRYFIDGIDIGVNYFANFPIELIDRIEVLRGGASAIYGQGAFHGAVNIITKSSLSNRKNLVNFEYGSYDYNKGSAVIHTKLNNFDIGIDAYYQKHDRSLDATTAPTSIVNGAQYYSIAETFSREKTTQEAIKDMSIGISIKNKEWSFTSRYQRNRSQNYYGAFGVLDHTTNSYTQKDTLALQLAYSSKISLNNNLKAKVGFLNSGYTLNTYYFQLEPNSVGFKDPHYILNAENKLYYTELSLINNYFKKHKIKLGAYFGYSIESENRFETNADAQAKVGVEYPAGSNTYWPYEEKLTSLYGNQGVFNLPGNQSQVSFYLQDLYQIYNSLDFSCNIRYDKYDYFTPMLSYRGAFVYSQDDINIYKFIYSHSYRLPSYNEAFASDHFGIFIGNPSLKPESVTTTELAYSYVKEQQRLHINTYYSIYKDAIDASFDDKFIIENMTKPRYSYGIEFEYTHNFANDKKLIFGASYTQYTYSNHTYNQDITLTNPNISPLTSSLSYIYPFLSKWTISTKIDYYNTKKLAKSDTTISDTLLVAFNVYYKVTKKTKIALLMKNLFNSPYYYPAAGLNTAPMKREGRTIFAKFQYAF